MNSLGFLRSLMLSACLSAAAVPACAEYRLQAGDVIEVAVLGVPDLRQRLTVQLDGTVSLYMIGTMAAEGVLVSELRDRIQTALASRVLKMRSPDGREYIRPVDLDEVSAVVVEYKPIYVSGNVIRVGEQVFRPRMTVRQALAAAGGTPSPATRNLPAAMDDASIRNEYISAWVSLAAAEARVWRIGVEQGDHKQFDRSVLPPSPVAESVEARFIDVETDFANRREAEHEKNKAFLTATIQQLDEQIQTLTEQKAKEEAGVQEDTIELQRTSELYGKGNLPSIRVIDARRAVLLSSTRKLQTTAELQHVMRTRAEAARDLDKADQQRHIDLLSDLRDANLKVATERARLQMAADKLQAAGLKPPNVAEGKEEIVIHRAGEPGGAGTIQAELGTELQPGDVLEVQIRADAGGAEGR